MSAKVEKEQKSYYDELLETQWDSIQEPNLNLSGLRNFIAKTIPFYFSALNIVDIVFDNTDAAKKWPSFGWTNGWKIHISPKLYVVHSMVVKKNNKPWFASPELGITFTILHELGHLIFDSFGRIQHRDPRLWNIATDFQINQFVARLMKECGIFKSDANYTKFMEVLNTNFCLDPAKYSKLSAEGTYDDIYRHRPGNDGNDWSLNGDMVGDGPDKKPLSSEEALERELAKSQLANYSAKNGSKLPGEGQSYGREFEMLLEPPKVNLRKILKHITDRTNTEDFNYSRRGSRWDHLMPDNMRLPSVVQSNPDLIRKFGVAIDFSGSLGTEQLKDALNIVREITCKLTRNPVYLIIHTDGVCWHGDIKDYKEVPTQYTGGTSFEPVYDLVKKLRKEKNIEFSVFLHLTDGYGEFGDDDYTPKLIPFYKKLIWIILDSDRNPCLGKVYHCDEVGC